MTTRSSQPFVPPHCPNPQCAFHQLTDGWRFARAGTYPRQAPPHRVQRFRCAHCGVFFSEQSFSLTYWAKRPELIEAVFLRVLSCSCYRQVAREHGTTHSTIRRIVGRLGRHCLLLHEQLRPKQPEAIAREPLVLDGLRSFAGSQYFPCELSVLIGKRSHFVHGVVAAERRRSGRMSAAQKKRRAQLERQRGRPKARSVELSVWHLLRTVVPAGVSVLLHTDEDTDYPRAANRLRREGRQVVHDVTSSRAPRTTRNPLFAANLFDLLVRHGSANHKRETIAFSKRLLDVLNRLWMLVAWRNLIKSFSEKKRDASPAQRLGLLDRRLSVAELLCRRLFPARVGLPAPWRALYDRDLPCRAWPVPAPPRPRYAW